VADIDESTLKLNYWFAPSSWRRARVLFDEAHDERNTLSWERALVVEPDHPEWGITLDPVLLWSPEDEGDFVVDNFTDHPAVEGVARMRTNWGGSLTVQDPAVAIAFTDGEIWQDVNENFQHDEGEATGPFTITAAYESGGARVAVVSDNSFQDDG
jgi:hypothetical protein